MVDDKSFGFFETALAKCYLAWAKTETFLYPFLLNNSLTEYSVTLLGLIMAMIIY